MKIYWLAICIVSLTLYGDIAEADTIRFTSDGKQFDEKWIYKIHQSSGRKMAGFIGDLIELEEGENRYYMESLRDHRDHGISVVLKVHGRGAEIIRYEVTGCSQDWRAVWTKPKVSWDKSKGLLNVHFSDVKFVRQTGTKQCIRFSSIVSTCTRVPYRISVSSNPDGAEIWLNENDTGFLTPVRDFAATFCESPEVELVLRKPGWVNCTRTFRVSRGQNVDVSCELRSP